MKKVNWKKLEKEFNILLLIIYIIVLNFSVYLFMVGFHNLDLGQNIRYLEAELDIKLVDQTIQGNIVTGTKGYIMGIKQIMIGFIIGLVSSFSLGSQLTLTVQKGKTN